MYLYLNQILINQDKTYVNNELTEAQILLKIIRTTYDCNVHLFLLNATSNGVENVSSIYYLIVSMVGDIRQIWFQICQ